VTRPGGARRRRAGIGLGLAGGLTLLAACGGDDPTTASAAAGPVADVTAVSVRGQEGAWTFDVTVASPDSGCGQYADWWEIVDDAGALLYRRVLLHSHVAEQPFTRSGGPVPVGGADSVWVRAHLSVAPGYGGQALRGTVTGGFAPRQLPATFAEDLATADPLPQGCAF
jgi:hypothetical protein